MLEVVFASNNSVKIDHYRYLEEELNIKFLDLPIPEIEETGYTYEENADIKGLVVSKLYPEHIIIAEDSGVEIAALGGKPGVYSNRAFGDLSYPEKIELFYSLLLPTDNRDIGLTINVVMYKNGIKLMNHVIKKNYEIPDKEHYNTKPDGDRSFGYNAFKKLEDGRLLASVSDEEFFEKYNPRRDDNLIKEILTVLERY